jgi:hypothetical protein
VADGVAEDAGGTRAMMPSGRALLKQWCDGILKLRHPRSGGSSNEDEAKHVEAENSLDGSKWRPT